MARRRSQDAAYHVKEECERLFCETLRTVFLVEKVTGLENSLVMDMRNNTKNDKAIQIPPPKQQGPGTTMKHDLPTPSASPDDHVYVATEALISDYVEVWDYTGSTRFRGFVAEKDDLRTLFIFFDHEVMGQDQKPGLMALLELAGSDDFDCSQLVICVDRTAEHETFTDVTKNLGWVGFELVMLDAWSGGHRCLSSQYVFLGMDV